MPLFFCLMAGGAPAGEWRLHAGDIPFAQEELEALPGQSFRFFDGGESQYGSGGAYAYTYSAENGGGTAWGTYRIAGDGSICVDFTNGFGRCDLYVHNGSRVILITEKGERFPVR
ncbi:hypothetical protein [Leisingera aquaemixtae]|uniref:hypothetical protein n=1 Tax=Leisingera aquaemixtae TaxID=1396826 RepID=UPI0028F6FFE9|nr:hypothetical protein [Leisingera aquaemixtae]